MSFNTSLSGINAANSDLNVTANNIANVNTTGFKESRAEFAAPHSLLRSRAMKRAAAAATLDTSIASAVSDKPRGQKRFAATAAMSAMMNAPKPHVAALARFARASSSSRAGLRRMSVKFVVDLSARIKAR